MAQDPLADMVGKLERGLRRDSSPKPYDFPVFLKTFREGEKLFPDLQAEGAGPSDSSTRVSPTNVVQKGRNLGGVNVQLSPGVVDFKGPAFPNQPDAEKSNLIYKPAQQKQQQAADSSDDAAILHAQGKGALDDLAPGASTEQALLHAQGKGALDDFGNGLRIEKQAAEDNAFSETGPMDYATDTQEMRRRAAFLGSGSARDGMKRVKAGLGIQEGNDGNYANIGGDLVKMDQNDFTTMQMTPMKDVDAFKQDWMASNLPDSSANPGETVSKLEIPSAAAVQQPLNTTITPESRNIPGRKFGPGGLFG